MNPVYKITSHFFRYILVLSRHWNSGRSIAVDVENSQWLRACLRSHHVYIALIIQIFMCEVSQWNSFKKNSALVFHFTFYFPCFIDRYKAHLCLLVHSHMHNTADRQCSKHSVRESKYSIFKCHICLISGTAQLHCILPEAVIFMSSYLSRFPFLSFIAVSDKIILSSSALPVLYSDVWGHFLNDHHS